MQLCDDEFLSAPILKLKTATMEDWHMKHAVAAVLVWEPCAQSHATYSWKLIRH